MQCSARSCVLTPISLHMQSGHREGAHPCGCMQAEAGAALDHRWMLCLLLILERARGRTSKWAPYISILPTAYGAGSLPL